jgi:hypothetical protein
MGVQAMHESDTYLAILDEGAENEAKRLILKWARKHLGQEDEQTLTCLKGITDLDRLERILDRFVDPATKISSWQDLLDTP